MTRTWSITTTGGERMQGYLPGWAEHDPSKRGVYPPGVVEVAEKLRSFADLLVTTVASTITSARRDWRRARETAPHRPT